jgi:fatty-acid desaturase
MYTMSEVTKLPIANPTGNLIAESAPLDETPERASLTVRMVTLVTIIVPLLGVVVAPCLVWGWGFGWTDLGLLLGMYVLSSLGVTAGFHRLFVHRSFEAYMWVKLFGPSSAQWPCRDRCFSGSLCTVAITSTATPLVHHVTWSVNSCHLRGLHPYKSDDQSRNNFVFGILALGEGWHNNHHAFLTSARHGLRWWQIDVSYWVLRTMALLGLAWNAKIPSKQAQEKMSLFKAT